MPKRETDYELMSEVELRQFRLEKYNEERAARMARRAAGEVLEERRAREDEKWRKAAEAARDLFRLSGDEHDEKTRELFAMSDDEMEEAIEQQQALGGLSRAERRAAARAGSSRIVVPPPDAGGDVPIAD